MRVDDFLSFGRDVYIADTARIKRPHLVKIGSHVAIGDWVVVTTRLEVGSYVHISPHVTCIGGEHGLLRMGNFTNISSGGRIICASDEHHGQGLVSAMIPLKYRDRVICEPIIMEDYSSLATNVIVVPGVRIGEGAVVGANSFVNKDVPSWEIWAGSPAKYIGTRPMEKMKSYGKSLLEEMQYES